MIERAASRGVRTLIDRRTDGARVKGDDRSAAK